MPTKQTAKEKVWTEEEKAAMQESARERKSGVASRLDR